MSFYETTLIPKPDKDITTKESYRPVSLKSKEANILYKVLANQTQPYIKRIIHHDHTRFIAGLQGCFNISKVVHRIHKSKYKNHIIIIISTDAEKVFDKIKHPLLIKKKKKKALTKVSIERIYLNTIKVTYDKLTPNIILNGEELRAFPLKSETRQGCPLSPLLFNRVLEIIATATGQEKGIKYPDWKLRGKIIILCR